MDLIERQEAINAIRRLPDVMNGLEFYHKSTIIAVLEDVPSVNEKLAEYVWSSESWRHLTEEVSAVKIVHDSEKDARKKGRWEVTYFLNRPMYAECSECKNRLYYSPNEDAEGTPNFCPNCGADMRGEEDVV